MKKLIYCISAIATLFFAASCAKENLEPVAQNSRVTYTIEVPGAAATKVIGEKDADIAMVNQLVYEVYRTEAQAANEFTAPETLLYHETARMIDGKSIIELELVNDQNYRVLFWAQCEGNGVYTVDNLKAVSVNTTNANANAENYAAFAGSDFIKDGEELVGRKVTLVRPVSQINIATTPESLTLGTGNQTTVTFASSAVTVKSLATKGISNTYNVATAEPGELNAEYTFKATDPDDLSESTIQVGTKDYNYVAMSYVGFAPATGANVEVSYTIVTDNVGTIKNTVPNVPLKPNYRTNIIGNLITSESDYEVVLDREWSTPDENVYVWNGSDTSAPAYDDATKTYTIVNAAELAWVAEQVNSGDTFKGKTFKLTRDIDLNNHLWTPIAASGVFEGTLEGATLVKAADSYPVIKNLRVKTEGNASAGLFASCRGTIKNINLENVNVEGHYKTGALVGDGMCAKIENCHVDGAVILSTPHNNDDANHVGGIVGYLSAEPTAYVKNSSVKNATITAYRDVAGIAGMANGASVVTGNSVENVTVIADQTAEYVEFKTANAGAIVERKHANANVAENTVGEGVVITYKVDSSEELNDVLKNGHEGAVIEVAAGSYDALANVKDNVTIIGAGYEYSAFNPVGTRFYGHSVVAGEGVTVKNAHFANPSANWVLNYQNAALHNVTFEKCWFNDTEGIRYAYAKENVTFTECIFGYESCTRGVHFDNKSGDAEAIVTFNKCTLYGFQALGGGVDKFIFNDCTFAENTRPQNVVNMYNYVEYNNCKFNPFMHCDCAGNGVTAAFNGCSYTDGSNITSIVRFDKDPSTCTITFDGMPYSDALNMTNVSDGLWTKNGDNGKTTYVATNANGLVALSTTTIKGGETVELGGDIDLAGVEFAGLNAFNPGSNNIFDGKGHVVSNLTYDDTATNDYGFIKNWVGPIKNVTLKDVNINAGGRIAALVAKPYGDIENCHLENVTVTSSYWAAGGLVGLYNAGSVKNCSAKNVTVTCAGGAGILVGVVNETAGERNFEDCVVEDSELNSAGNYGAAYSAAPIAGMINIRNSVVNFKNCKVINTELNGPYVHEMYGPADDDVKVYVDGIWDGAPKVKTVAALQEALETSESDVVVVEEAIAIPENETVALDLKGKTLKAATTDAITVSAGAKLTIKNGTIESNGAPIRALGGEVVIESGKYVQTGTAVGSAVATYRYAVDAREGGKVTIKGGEFESGNGIINVDADCEVVINGGKFTNTVEKSMTRHLAYVSGKLTINDGEFYGVANSSAGGCFFCGAAAGCDIQITGGKFTSLWSSGSVNRIFESYYGGTINVTGGLFNSNGGIESFVTENTDAATKGAYPYVAK